MRDVNQETISGTLSWFRILPLRIQSYPCKTKTSQRRRRRVYESSSIRHTSHKLDRQLIHWSLANNVKICDGIIDLQHLIDPRHMALLKEPYEEWKKELQQYCYSQAWMKNVVAGSMEWFCHQRYVQDLLADGKGPYERLFGEPFEGPIFCLEQWCWMSSDFSTRSINTSSIWQDSFTRNLSCVCIDRNGFWKGDALIADLEELEKLDASEIYPRRINAKEELISQKGEEFIFPVADGTAKLSRRYHGFREPTLRREQPARSEDLSGELRCEPEGPQPTESKDDAEVCADFWSVQGDSISRHLVEHPSSTLFAEGRNILVPLKYIDVTRSTHTDLGVVKEKCVDDCKNVDSNRSLWDSWKGFTKFSLLTEEPPRRYMWYESTLTKVQTTTRPDHVWPKVGSKNWNAAQNRENGTMRRPNSTMLDDWEECTSLIRMTKNTRKPFKLRGEN